MNERAQQPAVVFLSSFFNWFLPSFTEFFGGVLLGFTGFYRVSLSLNRFDWIFVDSTEFYRVLLSFTDFYRVLLNFPGFLSSFAEF